MPVPELKPRTLYDKIYESHIVHSGQGDTLLYCDRHIVHDVTSPQAFEGLREAKRTVRRPDLTLATADHNVPTSSRHSLQLDKYLEDPASRAQCARLAKNAKDFGVSFFGLEDRRQGIVHIIGPEQGFTLPGTVVVCGDSHSSTHGAFGALALGLGTSEVEHVLATQTIPQAKSKNMRISVDGELAEGVTAKDIILHIIGVIGTAGGTGSCIEYAGSAIRSLSMEGRMTVCNMSIEAGARAGIIQPDEKTIEYLRGRPLCPSPGDDWDQAEAYWSTLRSDPGATYDIEVQIRAEDIPPTVTWGTSPQDVVPITGSVPDESTIPQEERIDYLKKLEYMGLEPGTKMEDITIDKAFLGSCTNGRIEDLRSAAQVILASARNGGPTSVAKGVDAMVVPGSGVVKRQAEAEGLDQVFKRAGFDWREAGCSMCLGMNPDALKPRERCASTSNRNFEGRQGAGGRTHLMSPAMAVAAALTGRLADVRTLLGVKGSEVVPPTKTISTAYLEPMTLATHPKDVETGKPSQAVPESVTSDATSSGAGFTRVKGFAAPFTENNIDTDKMVPKQFLKTLTRSGLGSALFFPLRYDLETKEEVSDFVLNREPYRKAEILVSKGKNFAIGSAREHAAWATKDFGIRCVIAPSIGETYVSNCYKNGILCLELPQEQVDALYDDALAGKQIEVDLEHNRISRDSGESISFEIPAFRRHCLLNGLDDIALTLQHQTKISEYERQRAVIWPWLDDMSQVKRGSLSSSLSSAQKQTSW